MLAYLARYCSLLMAARNAGWMKLSIILHIYIEKTLLRHLGATVQATKHGSTIDPNLVSSRLQQVSKAVSLDKILQNKVTEEKKLC